VLSQSADLTKHGRDHAPGRPYLRRIGAVHVCNSTAPIFSRSSRGVGGDRRNNSLGRHWRGQVSQPDTVTAMEAAANRAAPAIPDAARPSTSKYISMVFSTRGRPTCPATLA
jgi:hypothetical protein